MALMVTVENLAPPPRLVDNNDMKAVRYLILGQISLFGFILICVILQPQRIVQTAGLSYFGVHAWTLVPYSLGLGLCSFFIVLSATALPARCHRMAVTLRILAGLLLGILVTPYAIGDWMDWIHMVVSAILFIIELVLAGWLVLHRSPDRIGQCWLALQLAGGLIAMVSLPSVPHIFNLEVSGQLIAQLGFSCLLIRSMSRLLSEKAD